MSSSPLQKIREDFGTARVDQIFSQRDSLAAIYTIDDGGDVTATIADPYSSDILNLREQVLSLEETHIFSPALINTARFGYSPAGYFFTGEPTPVTPAADVPGFLLGHPVGAVVVGGETRLPIRRRRSDWQEATMGAICEWREIYLRMRIE